MNNNKYAHVAAILQALLVTFLWSTSFIIIKLGLAEMPPLTYAGMRYSLAFLCFVPIIARKRYIAEIRSLRGHQWKRLIVLGLVYYALTQGTQFIGLSLLPSVTVSLMLNFTPLIVALMGIFLLKENPSPLQWLGSALFIMGITTYFFPISAVIGQEVGLAVMGVGVLANAVSAILGRRINRARNISPLVITFVSMGTGGVVLLISGIVIEGLPEIGIRTGMFLVWLAVVNTAFAFTVWNISLRTLTAMESSIINGTMLIQIAFLAWLFLDENVSMQKGVGMMLAAAGAIIVQIKRKNP